MYQYKAFIKNVVDGDTLEIDIDLGLFVWIHGEKIRLYGIDTPEVFGVKKDSPEWILGNKASNFVKLILKEKDEVIIETIKDKKEKYGRYLAVVYIKIAPNHIKGLSGIRNIGEYFCLNDILIEKGFAKKYMI
jgi:micrococcal nuclease